MKRSKEFCRKFNGVLVGLPPAGFAVTVATGHLGSIEWLAVLSWLTWMDARLGAWLAQD
jgi:hypothetical protein